MHMIHLDDIDFTENNSSLREPFKELIDERDELLSILRKICGQHTWQNLNIGYGSTHEWARNILDHYEEK